jgi:hypothetical protein
MRYDDKPNRESTLSDIDKPKVENNKLVITA